MSIKYRFSKFPISKSNYFIIDIESKEHFVLANMRNDDWTPNKVQEIIDGIEESKTLPKEEPYEWANEDVELNANENGVWLYDWLTHRAGEKDTEKLNSFLTHSEMITFLSDFKKFVEENQE